MPNTVARPRLRHPLLGRALVVLLLVPFLTRCTTTPPKRLAKRAASPATAPAPAPATTKPTTSPSTRPVSFEKEIAAYEAKDKIAPPPQDGILFVGSSSIRLWKTLEQDFPGLPVINRGFGGSQVHHVTQYADRIVIPYKPRLIVFYSVDNDLKAGKTPQQVRDNLEALLRKVDAKLPRPRWIILAVKPSIARANLIEQQRETNRLIQELVAKEPGRLTFVDIFTPMLGEDGQPRPELYVKDNLHMTPEGYKLWTSILKPLVK